MTDGAGASGTRDNGLRCASYVAVADLDPRVIGGLLADLRDNGIAAYATPTPASAGGYMELRLPNRPVDRLYVDETLLERAKAIVDAETVQHRDTESIDFEAAWQQVLTSLQSPPASVDAEADAVAPTTGASSYVVRPASLDDDESYDPADEEHYEPPPPPPFPKLRSVTVAALVAIALGLVLLAFNPDGGSLIFLAIVAIAGGIASLVWNMRNGPPTDSGWDDGAVV